MSKAILCLALLAASLAVSLAKPADVVARVPSNYYHGTKWVLFRDDNIPNPPHNVIQADNGVQVLSTYRYQQHPQYQSYAYVSQAPIHVAQPIHVTPSPVHIQPAPIHVPLQIPVEQSDNYRVHQTSSYHASPAPLQYQSHTFHVSQSPVHTAAPAHIDTDSSSQGGQKPQHQLGQDQVEQQQQQFNQQFQDKVQEIVRKIPVITKVSSFGVTAVPHTAVHVSSPAYFDLLRKKKSA